MLTWLASLFSPTSGSQPTCGVVVAPGNQSALKAATSCSPTLGGPSSLPSTKTADSPGARLLTPSSGTAEVKDSWLSFIFQPASSTLVVPTLVSSNQSFSNGLWPLLQGATSGIATWGAELPLLLGVTVSL